ncbi:uncharacterized protein LOC62_01G000810 [Vanrija pseudolonga]|uniref:Uncharacterized protein n=1 Tax=Vanrija pseudolonga TaxID=143232 RepID=A0AAF1BH81_9TREE|nr:hypothetical protein LOC62_01G000810 [Vanrija pseudolonga]
MESTLPTYEAESSAGARRGSASSGSSTVPGTSRRLSRRRRAASPAELPTTGAASISIATVMSARAALELLSSTRAWQDRRYAAAVLRSYVGFKVDRGKTKGYVSFKLAMLEYQLPAQFADIALGVRREYGLGFAGTRVDGLSEQLASLAPVVRVESVTDDPPPPYTGAAPAYDAPWAPAGVAC